MLDLLPPAIIDGDKLSMSAHALYWTSRSEPRYLTKILSDFCSAGTLCITVSKAKPRPLTLFCLFRIVLGPGYQFGLGHHILHRGARDTVRLLSAELHVTVKGVLTKLSPAEVARLIAVFGGAFS